MNYELATLKIQMLGSPEYMVTSFGEPPEDNDCGTNASGGYEGLKKWLEPYGIFVVGELNPLVIPSPSGTEILSLAPDPDGRDYYVITAAEAGGTNQMHHVSTITGLSELVPAPESSLLVRGAV